MNSISCKLLPMEMFNLKLYILYVRQKWPFLSHYVTRTILPLVVRARCAMIFLRVVARICQGISTLPKKQCTFGCAYSPTITVVSFIATT